MQRFADDDRGYFDWLDHHPDGFVINTGRTPSAAYLMLHGAGCGTISGEPARGTTFTGEYIKVCGERNELEEFAHHLGGQAQPCGLCLAQRSQPVSMCALALLAVATARPPGTPAPWATAGTGTGASTWTTDQPEHWHDTGQLPVRPGEQPPRDMGLIRVTVPEARRLLAPAAHRATETFRCTWSIWRRRHQARARWHHYQAQLRAAAA